MELLTASGHIAVPSDARGTILWRTLEECRQARWITVTEISPDFFSIGITRAGQRVVKDSD